MMARCLDAASTFNVKRDDVMEARIRASERDHDTYDPNPHGYWVPGDGVLPQHTPGQIIKVPSYVWRRVTGDHHVIWMRRPEDERLVSWQASFGDPDWPSDSMLDVYERGEHVLAQRHVTVVDYHEALADPVAVFSRLRDAGWPIDVDIAAALVDPTLHRHRSR